MVRQPRKLGVRPATGKDLGISFSDGASALAFKRSRDYRGTAPRVAGGDGRIHKLNELVRKANGDLLAHTNMVADCYHTVPLDGVPDGYRAMDEPGAIKVMVEP